MTSKELWKRMTFKDYVVVILVFAYMALGVFGITTLLGHFVSHLLNINLVSFSALPYFSLECLIGCVSLTIACFIFMIIQDTYFKIRDKF